MALPICLFIISCLVLHASAALYPTEPVQNTVYHISASSPSLTLTWKDDGTSPPLDQMGKMKIELYDRYNSMVDLLAQNVDPQLYKITVNVKPGVALGTSHYWIHFVPNPPHQIVYTASFTIVNSTSASNASGTKAFGVTTSWNNSQVTAQSAPAYTVVTAASTTYTLSHLSISHAVTTGVTTDAHTSTFSSGSGAPASTVLSSSHARSSAQAALRMENVKTRLLFVFWPVMIGIALAM